MPASPVPFPKRRTGHFRETTYTIWTGGDWRRKTGGGADCERL